MGAPPIRHLVVASNPSNAIDSMERFSTRNLVVLVVDEEKVP
jgi:hypothetical protein